MAKIEILTPEPEQALLILQDALAWHKRILLQSLARTQGAGTGVGGLSSGGS